MFTPSTLERVVKLSQVEHDSFEDAGSKSLSTPPQTHPREVSQSENPNPSELFTVEGPFYHKPLELRAEVNTDFRLLFGDLYCHVCEFKVLNNLCIIGFLHGSIILGSLEKNEIIAHIKAHSDKVTSITIWKNYILSTSLDGTVRYFNLSDSFTTKSLKIEEHLICADDDGEGVLYVGTKSGCIYKFNILAMTIITPFLQVSRYPIENIKLIPKDNDYRRKLLMFSELKWTLRDCCSGNKLMAFEIPHSVFLDYCPSQDIFLGLSRNALYRANAQEKGSQCMQVHLLPGIVTSSLLFDNILIVGFKNGEVHLYKENFEKCGSLRGIPNDYVTHFARWKNKVICYFAELKCIGYAPLNISGVGESDT